jgi:hypothetical protein
VSLVSGDNYRFKVQARNTVGYSDFSEEFTIRAAEIPTYPSSVATTLDIVNEMIDVSWSAPYNGGSEILSYTIVLIERDGSTYYETAECDGTDATIISTQTCSVSVYTFIDNPYNLQWGDSIYAKVTATNIVGTSDSSLPGNGAII